MNGRNVMPHGLVQDAVAGLLADDVGPRPVGVVGAELRRFNWSSVVAAVRAGVRGGWLEEFGAADGPVIGWVPVERRRERLAVLLAEPGRCPSPGEVEAAQALGATAS